jgi:dienelactone hydrolase
MTSGEFWNHAVQPDAEPIKVMMVRGEFTDTARADRVVPYKIYYPAGAHGPMPVIIWSHGFGGNRDGAGFISRFVAAYGYTLVHLTHVGSDSSLWEGQPGHPWEVLRKISINRAMTLARFADVSFAVDQLYIWARENPAIGAGMDFARLGMAGHSFGAMTTQAMAGQYFPDENDVLRSYRDARFQAGILYSPVPIRKLTSETPEPHIYGPIEIPLFHMTGTDDDSPLEGFGYDRRMAVYDYSGSKNGGADKYLLIKNDGDHMVYNGTRGQLAANPLRPLHENMIKITSLAFWDAYLKGDEQALAWLRDGRMAAFIGGDGTFKFSRGLVA